MDEDVLVTAGRWIGLAGVGLAMGLMMWTLIDLLRLLSLPKFSGFVVRPLRLQLMVLGIISAEHLEPEIRRRIQGVRIRLLLAVLVFVLSAVLTLVVGAPGTAAP